MKKDGETNIVESMGIMLIIGVGIVVVEGENGVRRADAGNGALSEIGEQRGRL